MSRILTTSLAIGLALLAAGADAQTKTAAEMYWNAVRASTGPIGFPRGTPDEGSRRPFRPRRGFGPHVFAPLPYIVPQEPVYIPVYVPGPIVYVPLPAAPLPPASAMGFGATGPPSTASATPVPRRPEPFYVIPGCYGGNRPPRPEALPAGCDIEKLRVSFW